MIAKGNAPGGAAKMNRAVQLGGADGAKAKRNSGAWNSSSEQRARLLDALRRGPVTTFYARSELDVLHPGGRIMELRHAGHNIIMLWSTETSDYGRPHRVGKYVLMQEALV